MNNSNIILRLKKTIVYIDKVLENFPKKEYILKKRITNCMYDILELSFDAYIDQENKNKIIQKILTKIKMLDFYLKNSFDKEAISHKNIKNISINLREITSMYYAWFNYNNEEKK